MIYYIADLHFYYEPVLRSRPFSSVEEMDRALTERWNQVVSPEDTVYVIGDVGYNGGHVPCRALARLHGRKHLVRGNHDTAFCDAPLLYRYFETVTDFTELEDGDAHVMLCHYPILYNKGGWMIHGHLHGGTSPFFEILRDLPRVLNAAVDLNGFQPVTLEQLICNRQRFYAEPYFQPVSAPEKDAPGRLPRRADFRPLPQKPPPHPRHLFITGEKGVGKSTVLKKLLEGRDAAVGGFRTVRVRVSGGGDIHMLPPDTAAVCTPENRIFTRRNGVLSIDPERFAGLGCALLESRGPWDLLLMDELGPAESQAPEFQAAVLRQLDGTVPIYGVLQVADSAFLEQVKSHPQVQVETVTAENRDALPKKLLEAGW